MNKKIIAQNQEIVIGTDVSTVKHNVAVTDAVSGDVLYNGTLKTSEAEWDRLFSRLPGCRTTVVYEAGPDGYALYDLARVKGHTAVVCSLQFSPDGQRLGRPGRERLGPRGLLRFRHPPGQER